MKGMFKENLAYAIQERFGVHYQDKQLAKILNVDRSTINRMRKLVVPPRRDRVVSLSRYFGVPCDIWSLPRDEFISEYNKLNRPREVVMEADVFSVSMPAIAAHRHLWRSSYVTHRGQYIAYWKADGLRATYVGSILEISDLDQDGITFNLINPYIRDDIEHDEIRSWNYSGRLYPVAEYLYFFGAQSESSYEILSLIMSASPVAPPDLLSGCLTGIHVKDGKKHIAVNIVVILSFQRKPITNWRNEVGKTIGKLPASQVPERIKRLIDPFPGVVTVP